MAGRPKKISAKKTVRKPKARDIEVGNRSLEAVLLDHAERMKEHEEGIRAALADIAVLARDNRAVLPHLFALTRDQIALADRTGKIEARVEALEKAS